MLISSNVFFISTLEPKKSAAPVMKENNRAMEVDTVIIQNMVVVMDTALLVDTDILMEVILLFSFVDYNFQETPWSSYGFYL